LLIPLSDRDALAQAQLNLNRWEQLLSQEWAPHVYLFTHGPGLTLEQLKAGHIHLVRSRMFAPALGITEDPATGSGATALGAYLAQIQGVTNGSLNFLIEQGLEMGRPSVLQVQTEVDQGKVIEIKVGGACVLVSEGTFHLD
jgi:trans-2,3-dihydro-3-hydroxyanthranilate isomerase